jgi:hypothetical protein
VKTLTWRHNQLGHLTFIVDVCITIISKYILLDYVVVGGGMAEWGTRNFSRLITGNTKPD